MFRKPPKPSELSLVAFLLLWSRIMRIIGLTRRTQSLVHAQQFSAIRAGPFFRFPGHEFFEAEFPDGCLVFINHGSVLGPVSLFQRLEPLARVLGTPEAK